MRYIFSIFLLLGIMLTSVHAEEISVTFYDSQHHKIADAWLDLRYEEIDTSNDFHKGFWRGVKDYKYVNPRPGMVSAGMKLDRPAPNELRHASGSFNGRDTVVIYLHPGNIVQDTIAMYWYERGQLNHGEWAYETDGGRLETGTFEVK